MKFRLILMSTQGLYSYDIWHACSQGFSVSAGFFFCSHFLVQLKIHFINGSFVKESGLWSYNKNELRPAFMSFTSVDFWQILGLVS